MAVCTPPEFADFVSDCADIVCARELTANYFLSLVASSSNSTTRTLFPPALVGASEKCGSVDLSVWLPPSPPLSGSGEDAATSTTWYAVGADTAVSLVSSANPAATAGNASPTYVWRPIVLAVLCTVLLVLIIADTILLICVRKKRMEMRKECCDQDHEPS